MPIAPPPVTYRCPACKWEKMVIPKSDALGPGEFFRHCPECGNHEITCERATKVDEQLGRLRDRLEDLFS